MKKGITAVILAGGIGERFWPISTDKVIFPFFGKTLFDLTVRESLPKEITRVVIVSNKANMQALKGMRLQIPHIVVLQSRPLGMTDALLKASSEIQDTRLIVFIADDIYDPSLLHDVINRAGDSSVFGIIPGWRTKQYFPGGYLELDGKEQIKGVIEKPGDGNEPSKYVNISGHYFADSNLLLNTIKKTKSIKDDVYEKAISVLMKSRKFVMVPYTKNFCSLKYPWHILDSMRILFQRLGKKKIGKNVTIKKYVTIDGDVSIEDGVTICEYTKIVGPCYIGRNTIIGNNNIIRSSHIGEGCVTGFNTDITRSYIGSSCWFHSNYIGDSVLENNVSLGAGTVLANLRLDEKEIASIIRKEKVITETKKLGAIIGKNVRIGVNTSIMPGVKIGQNCLIGAGIVVKRDLPDSTFCTHSENLIFKRNEKQLEESFREECKKQI